jgi:hypothetical protein
VDKGDAPPLKKFVERLRVYYPAPVAGGLA